METSYNFTDNFEHKYKKTNKTQYTFRHVYSGSGQYGRLFMDLTPQEWNNLPGTIPVLPPEDQALFTPPGRLTASEIAVCIKTNEDQKKKYKKFQVLQHILHSHILYLSSNLNILTQLGANLQTWLMKIFLQLSNFYINHMEKCLPTESKRQLLKFKILFTKSINILLTAVQE